MKRYKEIQPSYHLSNLYHQMEAAVNELPKPTNGSTKSRKNQKVVVRITLDPPLSTSHFYRRKLRLSSKTLAKMETLIFPPYVVSNLSI